MVQGKDGRGRSGIADFVLLPSVLVCKSPHGTVMAVQTVEAWNHSVHRNFTDVIVFLVIGVVLLVLLPVKREARAPVVA
jgi:hypothetical protein